MKENGLNINDALLVINVTIIYVQAQRDLLQEQINEKKDK